MTASPRIAIVGVGAVGTLLAYRLVASGVPVTLVARGRRAAQLREGLRLDDGPPLHSPVVSAAELSPHDVVFLAVKEGSLADVLEDIAPALCPETLLVPLVNGLPFWRDPEQRAKVHAKLVGAVTYVTASLSADGCGSSEGKERLVLGPPDGRATDDIEALATTLKAASIDTIVSNDILADVWSKVALNLATNPLSVVTRATLQTQFHDPRLSPLVCGVLEETIRLARASGVEPSMTLDEMLAVGRMQGQVQTSMLQDHLAGRPLELEAIALSCLRLASRIGTTMPITDAIVKMVAFTDDRSRGRDGEPLKIH